MTIEELIAEGEAIKASIDLRHKMGKEDEYRVWHQKVTRFLNQEVPGDIVIHKFEVAVKGFNSNYCSKDSFDKVLSVLKAFHALPKLTEDTYTANQESMSSIILNNNITQTQEQHQSQSQSANIFAEAIKDELRGRDVKELRQIIKDYQDNPEEQEKQLANKFKLIGSESMSRILAKIVQHPEVLPSI